MSCTTTYGFLAACQNLGQTNDSIRRKCLDRRKDRRTNRPYFIGTFLLLLGSHNTKLFASKTLQESQDLLYYLNVHTCL